MAPMPTASQNDKEYFDSCKSCGQMMMTTDYQLRLITACPEWGVTTLEEVRNILTSSGVHYLYEVAPGYCRHCSTESHPG